MSEWWWRSALGVIRTMNKKFSQIFSRLCKLRFDHRSSRNFVYIPILLQSSTSVSDPIKFNQTILPKPNIAIHNGNPHSSICYRTRIFQRCSNLLTRYREVPHGSLRCRYIDQRKWKLHTLFFPGCWFQLGHSAIFYLFRPLSRKIASTPPFSGWVIRGFGTVQGKDRSRGWGLRSWRTWAWRTKLVGDRVRRMEHEDD